MAPAKPEAISPIAAEKSIPSVCTVSIDDIRKPVAADMDLLVKNLTNVVGDRHPMLMAAAQQIFGAGGKKLRPMLVFLVAKATCQHTGR
jgi:all-trans-nonaprenyl-diphosphate synthase